MKAKPITGSIPAEFFIYDLWESMRKFDLELANEVLEPTFVFMRSQTDRIRLSIKELGEYLRYREKDVGKAYVSHRSQPPCLSIWNDTLRFFLFVPSQPTLRTHAFLDGTPSDRGRNGSVARP